MKVCLPFSPDALDGLPEGFEFVVADATQSWPDEAHDAEIYVPSYRFDSRVLAVIDDLPRLRVIQSLTAGVDNYPPLGDEITLCSGAGIHDTVTSELAVGLMIAAQRDFASVYEGTRTGVWSQQMTSSLADKRVLVIGAGRIAKAIEQRLAGFECAVTLVGRTARDEVRGIGELDDLLPVADIVVLIVPLTEQTRGLVDARFLAAMPDGALLVNLARGAVVVTDDLIGELSKGRLRRRSTSPTPSRSLQGTPCGPRRV